MRHLLITTFVALWATAAMAQNGFIRGKVIDNTTGEPLFGAAVLKQGTTIGTTSDFDGNYSLSLPVGTHTIVFQSVSFQTVILEDIEVKANEPTIIDMVMKEDVQQLGEVVVTAEVVKDNEIGVMMVQKKSLNTLDGISSSTFRKVGDSDLSGAMKRVTGVSVQGGKYVYVRGLGDRYTKTSINGMVMPGLDPDRNDVQIDIFPTGILENVLVYKTFTPNLTGSFTGGLVDIQTKAFPDEKSTSVSVGFGYNPDMHFNKNFLTYEGSPTDKLGFDNGARNLPVAPEAELASDNATSSLFSPTLGGHKASNFMNNSFSLAHRNQIKGDKITWGYNALLSYRYNSTHNDNFERRRYQRSNTGSGIDLIRDYTASGAYSTEDVLWSGLVSVAGKTDKATIGTNFLHIQNGISSVVKRYRNNSSLNNPTDLYNDILSYTQRQMTNNITYGKHQFGRLRLNWTNSLIFSRQYEPDYRETAINEDDGQLGFRNGGKIVRFWRDLSEVNESVRLDLEYEINDRNNLKLGGAFTYRDREFDVYNYQYQNLLVSNVQTTDPNDLLVDNIISDEKPLGLAIENATNASNAYDGVQVISAGYLMNEMRVTERLKSIYGFRIENARMLYTGVVGDKVTGIYEHRNNLETLNETNFLPSVSMIYNITEEMNLRGSFNKTLARPSFKEKSDAFIADPISAIIFNGNIDVKQAEILNYDVRWEYFAKGGQMVSASLFYKDFTNHIALVAYDKAPNQITPRNVGEAVAYGAELEGRKRLDFMGLDDFMLGGNFTYTISRVDRKTVIVDDEGLSEYDSEVENLANGDANQVDRYRNMSMQSPYSVNAFINYELIEKGITSNISYNVQGETLAIVSASRVPAVYNRPFHSLNFKVSKDFGVKRNSSLSFKVDNILKDDERQMTKLGSEYQPFRIYEPGRTFSVTYKYSF